MKLWKWLFHIDHLNTTPEVSENIHNHSEIVLFLKVFPREAWKKP